MTQIIPVSEKNISVYVPFGGNKIDLGEDAVSQAPEYPLLQYATGLPAWRPKYDVDGHEAIDEETGEALQDNINYAGFFTEHGKDKALDEVMVARGVPVINIIHASGETKKYWQLEKPTIFLMARGVPSNASSGGTLGIVSVWRQKRNSTKSESVIYAQVIIRHLLPHYTKPFVFTVKSTQTVDALNAFKRQYRVLTRAHEELRRVGNDMPLPLWSYSFVLGPTQANKAEMRGTEGASRSIRPLLSGIPDDAPAAYLQRHEVPLEYTEHFKECTEKAVEWATTLTQRIVAGVETHEPWQQQSSETQG